jgi:hypothetical protein
MKLFPASLQKGTFGFLNFKLGWMAARLYSCCFLCHVAFLKSKKWTKSHFHFTQNIFCKQKRNLEFVQDSSDKYVVRIKPRVVKREVVQEHTNQSQQPTDKHISVESERTNMDLIFPFVSQLAVNSLEAIWLLSSQLLTYFSNKQFSNPKFQKKLVTLIVAIWVLLRVIAVVPLLPEALELTGLVASVVVFYR